MEAEFQFEYVYILLFCVNVSGVILQLLLLNTFIKDPLKCFRNCGTYLVANLAVLDLLVCPVAPIATVLFMTKFFSYLNFFRFMFHNGSVITFTIISIERFVIVAYPLKHRLFVNKKTVFACLVSIWLLSCVHSTKGLIFGFNKKDFYFSVNCRIALVIFSIVIYTFTYKKLNEQFQGQNAARATSATHISATEILKQKRFLRTIILVACLYIICCAPVLIFLQILLHSPHLIGNINHQNHLILVLLFSLYHVNFAINPLIYFIRLPNYRKTFI